MATYYVVGQKHIIGPTVIAMLALRNFSFKLPRGDLIDKFYAVVKNAEKLSIWFSSQTDWDKTLDIAKRNWIELGYIVVDHDEDSNHILFVAARIAARAKHEEVLKKLKKKYGDFGSGHMDDPETLAFLEKYKTVFGEYPAECNSAFLLNPRSSIGQPSARPQLLEIV